MQVPGPPRRPGPFSPRLSFRYGGAVDFDFGGIEVIEYAANAAFGGK